MKQHTLAHRHTGCPVGCALPVLPKESLLLSSSWKAGMKQPALSKGTYQFQGPGVCHCDTVTGSRSLIHQCVLILPFVPPVTLQNSMLDHC